MYTENMFTGSNCKSSVASCHRSKTGRAELLVEGSPRVHTLGLWSARDDQTAQ